MTQAIPPIHEFPYRIRDKAYGFGIVYDDFDILLHDHHSVRRGTGIVLEWPHLQTLCSHLPPHEIPVDPHPLGEDRLGDSFTIHTTRTGGDIIIANSSTDDRITLSSTALSTIIDTLETLEYPEMTPDIVSGTTASEYCGAISQPGLQTVHPRRSGDVHDPNPRPIR